MFAIRKDGNKVLLKMEFLGDPKNSKGEIRENWNYLKIRIWERYLQNGIWEIIFKNQIWRNPRISHGLKVAMQTIKQGGRSRWQMNSWVKGVDLLSVAIAAPPGLTSTLNTRLAWPDMAPIKPFPPASYMCAWPSYIPQRETTTEITTLRVTNWLIHCLQSFQSIPGVQPLVTTWKHPSPHLDILWSNYLQNGCTISICITLVHLILKNTPRTVMDCMPFRMKVFGLPLVRFVTNFSVHPNFWMHLKFPNICHLFRLRTELLVQSLSLLHYSFRYWMLTICLLCAFSSAFPPLMNTPSEAPFSVVTMIL